MTCKQKEEGSKVFFPSMNGSQVTTVLQIGLLMIPIPKEEKKRNGEGTNCVHWSGVGKSIHLA